MLTFNLVDNSDPKDSFPQGPHIAFAHDDLDNFRRNAHIPYLAFFPVTEEGMYLRVWRDDPKADSVEAPTSFIPFGVCLLLAGDTLHGEGMSVKGGREPPCGHAYIYFDPSHPENKNTYHDEQGRSYTDKYI